MNGVSQTKLRSNEDWLGREGSNLRITGPKPVALPLGYAPIKIYWKDSMKLRWLASAPGLVIHQHPNFRKKL